MNHPADLDLKSRRQSLAGLQLRLLPLDVEPIAQAGVRSDLRQAERVPLQADVLRRNRKPSLRPAQFRVMAGHFAQQADKDIAPRFFEHLDFGRGGFESVPFASKQVKLPGSVKTELKDICLKRRE